MSAAAAEPRAPWTAGERLAIAAILVIAAAIRMRAAALTPLWFDELFTLWMARHPLREILPLLSGDIHPPLPTLLVAGWRAVGGDHPLWLKSLPLAIGLLTVAATIGFGRALFGPRPALAGGAFLALHPMHVYFSQEVRSYGLLTLALLLSTWMAWRWVAVGRTRDAALWVLAAALTVHTHYLGVVVLAVLDAWVVARLWRTPRRLLPWLAAHGAVLVLALPLAGLLPGQLALSRTSWVPEPRVADLVTLFRKIAFGALYLVPALAALAWLALARRATRADAALAWWMLLGPIAVTYVITLAGGHLFTERYLFFTLPYACLLFAAGAAALSPAVARRAATVVVLAFAARAVWLWHPLPEPVALRDVSALIARRLEPGDLVFCADTHSLLCVDHHLGGDRALLIVGEEPLPYYLGGALVAGTRRVPADSLRRAAATGRRWWAVRTREGRRSTAATAALADSLAAGARVQRAMVTLWAGLPGMLDTTTTTTPPGAGGGPAARRPGRPLPGHP